MRWLLLLAVPAVLFAQGAHPRIGVAELSHESNSFNPKLTTFDDFAQRTLTPAADVVNDWARSKDPVSGFVLGARQHGLDLVPIFAAAATPKGPVSADGFERLTALLVSGLKSAPKLAKKEQKLIDTFNDSEFEAAKPLAEELLADPAATDYDKALVNFLAAQIAYNLDDNAAAKAYAQKAIELAPARCSERITKSTAGPGWPVVEKGG